MQNNTAYQFFQHFAQLILVILSGSMIESYFLIISYSFNNFLTHLF